MMQNTYIKLNKIEVTSLTDTEMVHFNVSNMTLVATLIKC